MNRQTRRTLHHHDEQEALAGDEAAAEAAAAPAGHRAPRRAEPARASLAERLAQYFREVRAELAKVLWPKRSEVVNYSTVVLTTLVLIALLIFGLNYLFAHGVLFLFKS